MYCKVVDAPLTPALRAVRGLTLISGPVVLPVASQIRPAQRKSCLIIVKLIQTISEMVKTRLPSGESNKAWPCSAALQWNLSLRGERASTLALFVYSLP